MPTCLRSVRKAVAFRKSHRSLQRKRFYQGRDTSGNSIPDIAWFGPDAQEPDWHDTNLRTLCYQLDAARSVADEDCLLFFILNADPEPKTVLLPACACGRWHRVIDTALEHPDDFLLPGTEQPLKDSGRYRAQLAAWSYLSVNDCLPLPVAGQIRAFL